MKFVHDRCMAMAARAEHVALRKMRVVGRKVIVGVGDRLLAPRRPDQNRCNATDCAQCGQDKRHHAEASSITDPSRDGIGEQPASV